VAEPARVPERDAGEIAGSPRPRRIALFGGTFDPPHCAHLELARTAIRTLALDEVRWIPAGQPWQKARRISAPLHREAMVRAAIDGEPRFVLDRCELQREGPSYTLDTVRELQSREPGATWFLLIGRDQYAGLQTWHGWQELLARVTLAVANRPGRVPDGPGAMPQLAHDLVPLPMLDISSTDIRRRVACGEPVDHLVTPAVARYIARHHLYRKDAAAR
jgi:nicotinate-nucleotide adenylyltransferase